MLNCFMRPAEQRLMPWTSRARQKAEVSHELRNVCLTPQSIRVDSTDDERANGHDKAWAMCDLADELGRGLGQEFIHRWARQYDSMTRRAAKCCAVLFLERLQRLPIGMGCVCLPFMRCTV